MCFDAALMPALIPPPSLPLPSPPRSSYLENQMAVALGGRVAEELIYGPDNVTTGASGDFQQVR